MMDPTIFKDPTPLNARATLRRSGAPSGVVTYRGTNIRFKSVRRARNEKVALQRLGSNPECSDFFKIKAMSNADPV